MDRFIATNPKQLDLCLKMLYAEKMPFSVVVVETTKGKITYHIGISSDAQTFELLLERYRILVS